ncbi:heme peroxidase [Polychytrium aggregatum]|uniref:heme peroxidase n=1 Tax=Polychytrium aggregatum TaxID=110093 RepID=UPI0022FEC420|nr:heme peroxidase [Polychytrium aggregatum]KAI9209167.1 heme peroxidase [Polychytrium aggregatum]
MSSEHTPLVSPPQAVSASASTTVTIPPAASAASKKPAQATTTLSALSQIRFTDQLYIFGELIKKNVFGWVNPALDDRRFPLEQFIKVNSTLPLKYSNSVNSSLISGFWQDFEHPQRNWPASPFREADGSNNSHIYPHMGASGTPYARTVTPSVYPLKSSLPDPVELFNDLLRRPEDEAFEPHPTHINSLLFAFATIITHDLFRTKANSPGINESTHYADLSCLYGANIEEQTKVRLGQRGLLKPDSFTDMRLQFHIPTTSALLMVFARNHNYIAEKLLSDEVNVQQENCRFTHIAGPDSPRLSSKKTDELVFQTARLINGACYATIILHEYIKSILDLDMNTGYTLNPGINPPAPNPTSGNVLSLEFGYIYRWHGAISQQDAEWLKHVHIAEYMTLRKKMLIEIETADDNGTPLDKKTIAQKHMAYFSDLMHQYGYTREELSLGPICIGLHRNPQTAKFDDTQLIQILRESMDKVASRFGPRKIPGELIDVEVQGIQSARLLGMCTINDFRRKFNLKPYSSYEELITCPSRPVPDKRIIAALEKHYGKNGIERVEFYPGVLIEGQTTGGICLPYSAARSILSDATNLIRNDRFIVDGINPHDLTHWGFDYITKSGDDRPDGYIFKKIITNVFPEWAQNYGADGLDRLRSPFKSL